MCYYYAVDEDMQNAKSLEEYISILKSEFVSSYDRNAHLYDSSK